MKCPSRFCGFENEDKANYCGKCGLDLKTEKHLILIWDGLYASFLDTKKEMGDKFPKDMSLLEFREMMKDSPLLAFVLGMRGAMNWDKPKEENTKKIENISFSKSGLYSIFLKRLKKLEQQPNRLIKFPIIFQTICSNFKMSKDEAWDVLFMLNEFGFVKIVPFNGIILLY